MSFLCVEALPCLCFQCFCYHADVGASQGSERFERANAFIGCAGQELRSDSRLVQDAGLVEGHSIHAIYTPQNNSYTEPAPAVAGAQRSASPALLLAQQVTLQTLHRQVTTAMHVKDPHALVPWDACKAG